MTTLVRTMRLEDTVEVAGVKYAFSGWTTCFEEICARFRIIVFDEPIENCFRTVTLGEGWHGEGFNVVLTRMAFDRAGAQATVSVSANPEIDIEFRHRVDQ